MSHPSLHHNQNHFMIIVVQKLSHIRIISSYNSSFKINFTGLCLIRPNSSVFYMIQSSFFSFFFGGGKGGVRVYFFLKSSWIANDAVIFIFRIVFTIIIYSVWERGCVCVCVYLWNKYFIIYDISQKIKWRKFSVVNRFLL